MTTTGDGLRLWVDDERPAPDGFSQAFSSAEAIRNLWWAWECGETVQEVSLDHDLGGDDTGMKVLDWIITNDHWPQSLTIHTANPPARKQMLLAANAEAPAHVVIYVITDHAVAK